MIETTGFAACSTGPPSRCSHHGGDLDYSHNCYRHSEGRSPCVRFDRRVVSEPTDLRNGRSVVEAHHKFGQEDNSAGPASHGLRQIGTVRRNHEIAASLCLELGFEDKRAGTVASFNAEQPQPSGHWPKAQLNFLNDCLVVRFKVSSHVVVVSITTKMVNPKRDATQLAVSKQGEGP
jgi:hypothetical protein